MEILSFTLDIEPFSHKRFRPWKLLSQQPKQIKNRCTQISNFARSKRIKPNLENKPCFSSEYHLSLFQSLFIQFQRKAFSLSLSLSLETGEGFGFYREGEKWSTILAQWNSKTSFFLWATLGKERHQCQILAHSAQVIRKKWNLIRIDPLSKYNVYFYGM